VIFAVKNYKINEKMNINEQNETAIFAGGCFWGTEEWMRDVEGVISTEVGYAGGTTENPSYVEVRTGKTGHAEVVRVVFDPTKVSYEDLARLFFEIHDPTQVDRQGSDIGTQYRSEIFYATPQQKETAEALIDILEKRGYRVVTRLTPATEFYRAEEYHQQYVQKTGEAPCPYYAKRF
jgi:peptide methionine sulfoxide reductase msrA/msrB